MQSFEEYRKDFIEDTLATEESEANGTTASFVKLCALKLFEGDVIPEFTPCFYQGTGYRNAALRVDGYSYDEYDKALYMMTALYLGGDTSETLIGSEAKTSLDRCRAFASHTIEYDLTHRIEISTEAYDLASLIEDQKNFISRIVVILLTDMSLSERANLTEEEGANKRKKKTKRKGVLDAEDICGIPVEYRIWDMPRFYRVFGLGDGHEEIEIDFNDYLQGGIPCLPANNTSQNNECRSYLCTVPGNVIADLYDEYGSRLLEGNVRAFLGRRGVNKAIRNTVLNEPDMFFVYNNGLAATVTEAEVKGERLLYAKDLQIVNGGQTTATLSVARHNGADLASVSVLMKLTQVPAETSAIIVPMISRSANSQNRINPADFFSTHEFHIRMEQMSRREFAPAKAGAQHETHWFYERARGQYNQATMYMTKAQERKFKIQNPKDQVITKTDLAKILNSWEKLPHIVSKGAEACFGEFAKKTEAEWKQKKDDFNIQYFHEAIALAIIFRSLDKLVARQPWYEGGYKANVVTYTIALLHCMIEKHFPGKELDLNKIWQKQQCSDVLMQQLTLMAEEVYYMITSTDRLVENVTQWCKQEACWLRVKELDVKPIDGFESVLQGYERRAAIQKQAREIRKIDNTIDEQKQVLDLGEPYWMELDRWLKTHPLATSVELKALRYAITMSQGNFPDDRQCKNLIKLRERAIQEGFPPKLK